jgi:tetratricopeptide (TPR) repeat protein
MNAFASSASTKAEHADQAEIALSEAQCAEFETLSVADPAKAAAAYEALWSHLVARNDVASAVRVTRAAIQSLAHLGDTLRAIQIAARARRVAHRDGTRASTIEAARVLIAAMHPRAKRGNLQAAMRGGLRATNELAALGEDALVARAELNLANVAKALGQPTRAVELLERVLARGSVIDPIRGAALNALGEARVQSGDFVRAVEAFERTARLYDAQGGALHSALARGNVAHTLAKAGEIEKALRAFRHAREQFAQLGAHAEACRLAIEEAELLEDAGLLDDAADLIDEARVLARRHSLRAELARTSFVSGRIDVLRGRVMAAKIAIDEAISVASSMADRIAISQALVAKSACLAALSDLVGARRAAHEAHQIAETPLEKVAALIALVERDPVAPTSLAFADEAFTLARSLGLPSLESEAMLARAVALSHAGRVEEALEATRNSVVLLERAQSALVVSRLRRSYLSHRGRAYTMLATQLLQQEERVAEAIDALESARHRAIVEALLEPTDPFATSAQHDLRATDLGAHETRVDVLQEVARLRRKEDRAELDERVAHTSAVNQRTTRLQEVGRPQCTSLVYFERDDQIDVIMIPANGVPTVRPIAGPRAPITASQLYECIGRFRFQIARYLTSGATTRSTHITRALFDELRAHLFGCVHPWLMAHSHGIHAQSIADGEPPEAVSCVIVPCASIAGLPLCTLMPDGIFASVAPSLGIAALLDSNDASRTEQVVDSRTALVVSVSDHATPGLAREGTRVAAALGAHTQHLDGDHATRAAFRDALASAETAHIACHGIFPPTAPNLAGLLLADGWFGAHHAHALERAPREIVLSGCSTGLAADGAGEQWLGLVRGFAARGTARMLASLWPVVDRDAEAFMEALYTSPALDATLARTTRSITIARAQLAQGVHPAAASAWTVLGGSTAFASRASQTLRTSE